MVGSQTASKELEHFYTYGDLHETLEACDQVERLLGRLKRQHLLTEDAWSSSRSSLDEIRSRVEEPLVATSR